jgi:quercetin dioxygenase-like cupin family protein
METPKPTHITVDLKGDKILSAVNGNYQILISSEQTNGTFVTIEMLMPPQKGPGPHFHARFYESFYIVNGEVEVHSEARVYIAKKGSFIMVPEGGIVHYFRNISNKMAQLLCLVAPARLKEFFEEIGNPIIAREFLATPPLISETTKNLKAFA